MEMARPPPTLPEDVALEILARLDCDVATLFRCATACKAWRRLIAEPPFLLRQSRWPPSLVGFFTQQCLIDTVHRIVQPVPNSKVAFIPLPGPSPFGTMRRPLSSLVPAGDASSIVDRSVPLDTRGGFLLVRMYPRDMDMLPNIVRLAVCNLLAGRWDVLPVLDCNTGFRHFYCPYSCDIVPISDGDNPRPATAFRVLMIGKDKDKSQINLHTLASGEASWRAPMKCFDTMEHPIWSLERRKAVICRGYAHWLFVGSSNYFHILRYNVKTESISLTKLLSPTKAPTAIMGEDDEGAISWSYLATMEGGTLWSLLMYRGGQLEIWTHDNDNGDDDANWECTRVINHKLANLFQQLERPYCIWTGERSNILLVVDCTVRRIYKAYLDNGTLEEVTSQFRDHHGTIIPMEIDWPTFFMACLDSP